MATDLRLLEPPGRPVNDCDEASDAESGVMPVAPRVPLVDRARRMRASYPLERLETGLATLDEACRGGLAVPRFVVVGGAPGAGKTTLVVWWALRWARAGRHVVMLAQDEGADDIVMRLAAEQGLDVDKLEHGDADEWGALEAYLEELGLVVLDGDDGWTIEAAAQVAAETTGGVLIVDSIQTVNALVDKPNPTIRDRVEAVVSTCKRCVKKLRILVVATSELARAAYRNKSQADNIDPLAAFAESRATEYAGQTALVLRSVPEGDGVVEVCVPKNRGGRKPTFHMVIDQRTRIEERAIEENDRSSEAKYEDLRREVMQAIRKGGLKSANAVFARVGKRRNDVLAIVAEELESGKVVKVNGELRIGS